MNARIATILALVAALLPPGVQAQRHSGVVAGHVRDAKTGEALPGANVLVVGTPYGASTDLQGMFRIRGLPPGTYTLRALMIGYTPGKRTGVRVSAGDTTRVDFELQPSVVELSPVVVTADKSGTPIEESTTSVSVIGARELEQRAPVRLDKALEIVPGVFFVGNHVNIRACSGYSRGAGTRVLFLVDGVPTMAGDTGEINWDALPVMDIERIEVVKGAASALYGSNALGGVINVITRTPTSRHRTLFRMTAGVYGKPVYPEWRWTNRVLHYDRLDISHSQKLGPVALDLSFGRHESTGDRQNGHFRRYNVSTKVQAQVPWGGRLLAYAAYEDDKRGEFTQWLNQNHPFEVPVSDLKIRARLNALNVYLQYFQPLSPRLSLKWRASVFRTLMRNQYRRSGDFNPAFGQGTELQGDYLLHPRHSITAGIELKQDVGHNKFIGHHQGLQVGPYVHEEWRISSRLKVVAGARFDRYTLLNENFRETHLSPRAGINYRPFAGTALRLGYAKGFRAASVTERYLRLDFAGLHIIPNPDLRSEVSEDWDFGIRQQLTPSWYVDLSLFRNDYWNLIEAVPDPFLTVQFKNVTRARISGFELDSEGSWWRDRLSLRVGITYTDHRDLVYHKPLAYRPKWTAVFSPQIRLGRYSLQADYRYASRFEEVQLFPMDPRVPMKILDVRFLIRFGQLTLQFAANNALAYYYTFLERNLGETQNFAVTLMGAF
ncbi:MAG TPA: TonB-dependent receptor [Bacteroidetes bacterium]|nr:TonB-dependent receptor [Bacteroidota bacterium]